MRRIAIRFVVLTALALPAALLAQVSASDSPHLAFDVVSIRRSVSGPGPAMVVSPMNGDGIIVRNASLREIIGEACGIRLHDLIAGVPSWADSDAYDIDAKVAASDLPAFHKLLPMQRNPMLLPVLVDRFHLVFHFEDRMLAAYALVVAKGGPKLVPVKPRILPDGREDPGGIDVSRDEATTAKGASMLPLVHLLQMQIGRPVVDRTGLTGQYDFTLHFARGSVETQVDGDPSVFSAVQEQLGLKLEPVKASVAVLVVDRVERPSEN